MIKEKKFKKLKFPKKFILMGTDNDGYRHRYSVEKNEGFKKIFIKFMLDLGFVEKELKQGFWSSIEDKNEEHIHVELKISDFEDCCRHYENKKYDIDVFYGNKKIIFVIRCKERKIVVENLEDKSKWKKFLNVTKLKEKNKAPIPMVKLKHN